ncbi:hypothetical protein MHYP_G00252530, partial [Metynnis hypsauchen]
MRVRNLKPAALLKSRASSAVRNRAVTFPLFRPCPAPPQAPPPRGPPPLRPPQPPPPTTRHTSTPALSIKKESAPTNPTPPLLRNLSHPPEHRVPPPGHHSRPIISHHHPLPYSLHDI